MLAKNERLTKTQFNRVFSVGKRYHSPSLQCIYDKTPTFHCAAVVGKKVYKKAVDRNCLRRRIYNVVYRYCKTHQVAGTFILVAKPAITKIHKKEFVLEVEQMLQHL